jgi:hypothetical protein
MRVDNRVSRAFVFGGLIGAVHGAVAYSDHFSASRSDPASAAGLSPSAP